MKEQLIELLVWLKDNKFHQYKEGTWYTINERPYVLVKNRKFYTEEQVIKLFLKNN